METIVKKRPNNKSYLIWLQYTAYGLYWMSLNSPDTQSVLYLYLLATFEGYNEAMFSNFLTFQTAIALIGSFIAIPLMSNHFKLHDTIIQMTIIVTESLIIFLILIASEVWQIYLVQSIGFLWVCKWSITRSLISKTVEPNELGKALSGIAIVAAAIPSATTPAIRELYKGTIEIFPGSIAILSGLLF